MLPNTKVGSKCGPNCTLSMQQHKETAAHIACYELPPRPFTPTHPLPSEMVRNAAANPAVVQACLNGTTCQIDGLGGEMRPLTVCLCASPHTAHNLYVPRYMRMNALIRKLRRCKSCANPKDAHIRKGSRAVCVEAVFGLGSFFVCVCARVRLCVFVHVCARITHVTCYLKAHVLYECMAAQQ